MKPKEDTVQLRALRRKLYARTSATANIEQHGLTDEPVPVSRNWELPVSATRKTEDLRQSIPQADPAAEDPVATPPKRRRYRIIVLAISLFIFIIGAGLSSMYLFLGGNQVSSDKISVAVTGPFSIGGGQATELIVSVSNQNDVPIESAALIVRYPVGTQSVGEAPRRLLDERIPIAALAPGEARNIPLQVAFFGEEQTSLTVTTELEYRISGSNSTFSKPADPLTLTISSTPVLVRLDSTSRVAAGQRVPVTVEVVSNAPTPLQNVLVELDYPSGYAYETAEPRPDFSNNVWQIPELLPQETVTIALSGIASGLTEESFRISAQVGQAGTASSFATESVLAQNEFTFTIERPFIDVLVEIDGQAGNNVVLDQGSPSNVTIAVENTLDETVYDMYVEAIPKGNVINDQSISARSGFYDSNRGTIRWEVANNRSFAQVGPGEERQLSFSINPNELRGAASVGLLVNVYARRVAETSATEQLIGTAEASADYTSTIVLGSQVEHATRFAGDGPIPPVVGETTTYTVVMAVTAGFNDLTDGFVTTGLPVYVDWLNTVEGDGEITYNPINKTIRWDVGNIEAEQTRSIAMQVSVTPSTSQVGGLLTLLNRQNLSATDRFTNVRLQARAGVVRNELSTEFGFEANNGRVQAQ